MLGPKSFLVPGRMCVGWYSGRVCRLSSPDSPSQISSATTCRRDSSFTASLGASTTKSVSEHGSMRAKNALLLLQMYSSSSRWCVLCKCRDKEKRDLETLLPNKDSFGSDRTAAYE